MTLHRSERTEHTASRPLFFNALFVGVLALYILIGWRSVPFHGDETSFLLLSKDVSLLLGDISTMYFQPEHYSLVQDFRLLNGSLSKYGIAVAWSAGGFSADQIPGQWDWGADWNTNIGLGAMPSDQLLIFARLPSTLMAMICVAVVFVIARRIGANPYAASLLFATLPAVLVNTRRTMQEGAMLLTGTVLMLVAVYIIQRGLTWRRAVWLGLAAGFAFAAKHNNLFVIGAVWLPLAILTLHNRKVNTLVVGRWFVQHALAVGIMAFVFLTLNPTWWRDPINTTVQSLKNRASVLNLQQELFGTYADLPSRLIALVNFPLGTVQYFEAVTHPWDEWLAPQIAAYEARGLGGINWLIAFALVVGGGVVCVVRANRERIFVLAMTTLIALCLLATTPLPWQRYYLLLVIPYVLLFGIGVRALQHAAPHFMRTRKQLPLPLHVEHP